MVTHLTLGTNKSTASVSLTGYLYMYIYIYIYIYIKKQCKTQKPTRSILNASFRSIYSDLPQAKSVTGLLNTTSMYLII